MIKLDLKFDTFYY